mgnify:CR=1 FL=1
MEVPELSKAPIAILANKKDLPVRHVPFSFVLLTLSSYPQGSISKNELIRAFVLEATLANPSRPIAVFRTSTIEGSGYGEAFQWLSGLI